MFITVNGKMAINPSAIASQSVKTNNAVVIEILPVRPEENTLISPPKAAGQLCGYYDSARNWVELYVVSASGIRYLRVG